MALKMRAVVGLSDARAALYPHHAQHIFSNYQVFFRKAC